MSLFLNKKVLERTTFSSNTIGPIAYLAHKMSSEGDFIMQVREGERVILKRQIRCSAESDNTLQYIDMAEIGKQDFSVIHLNVENGYLLFYNSREFGDYKIEIKKGLKTEFNSLKPSKGDIYSLNLIRPGAYELKSSKLKSALNLNVEYPKLETSKEARAKDSLSLNLDKITKSKEVKLFPNQGINIELEEGLQSFQVKLTKEFIPKRGESIEEQLKKRIQELVKLKKAKKKKKILKKYEWRSKTN